MMWYLKLQYWRAETATRALGKMLERAQKTEAALIVEIAKLEAGVSRSSALKAHWLNTLLLVQNVLAVLIFLTNRPYILAMFQTYKVLGAIADRLKEMEN